MKVNYIDYDRIYRTQTNHKIFTSCKSTGSINSCRSNVGSKEKEIKYELLLYNPTI